MTDVPAQCSRKIAPGEYQVPEVSWRVRDAQNRSCTEICLRLRRSALVVKKADSHSYPDRIYARQEVCIAMISSRNATEIRVVHVETRAGYHQRSIAYLFCTSAQFVIATHRPWISGNHLQSRKSHSTVVPSKSLGDRSQRRLGGGRSGENETERKAGGGQMDKTFTSWAKPVHVCLTLLASVLMIDETSDSTD